MWRTVALDLVRDAKAGDEAAFGQLLAPEMGHSCHICSFRFRAGLVRNSAYR
jgi:hypothetical protein